jgi:uncharacterized membrane protein YuzA (DUF378 family)
MSVNVMQLAESLVPTMNRGIKVRLLYLFVGLAGFFFPAFMFSVVAKSAVQVLKDVPEAQKRAIMDVLSDDHA